jgi:hypothetical protein
MKIPEPMIPEMTIIVASKSVRRRAKVGVEAGGRGAVGMGRGSLASGPANLNSPGFPPGGPRSENRDSLYSPPNRHEDFVSGELHRLHHR